MGWKLAIAAMIYSLWLFFHVGDIARKLSTISFKSTRKRVTISSVVDRPSVMRKLPCAISGSQPIAVKTWEALRSWDEHADPVEHS